MEDHSLFPGMESTNPQAGPGASSVEGGAAPRLRCPDRRQMLMTPCEVDALIPEDHEVRTLWAVVERLDLSGFYARIKARGSEPGRSATDPKLLVGLWLYATKEGVGSARQLEALCREHNAYRWLCGGLNVNYHTLSDFRVDHGPALDDVLTKVLASLVDKKLVTVWRICQDGTRVRACAGASSFRRKGRLEKLLEEARVHVGELKKQLEDPAVRGEISAKRRKAQERAVRERQARIEAALEQLPALEKAREKLSKKVASAKEEAKEPRASTTDADARRMRMADGGYRPGYNIQIASDPGSRAIVGVEVTNAGVDTDQGPPMREQVERRTDQGVGEHLMDSGYLKFEEIEKATKDGVTLYVPPKPPRNPEKRKSAYEPRPGDSEEVAAWRARMGSEDGKQIYLQRTATSETINGDLKTFRSLGRILVRGIRKVRCVVLWNVLVYNLMHFGQALLS
jgi:transposase